jgi:3-oxoadipate enol-lactonase
MPVAKVGDIELDYERSGSGPPLLLIMGLSGTALHWGEPFLDALRRDFEVIVYDHHGVGASSRLDGPITIVEMAQDAIGLLDALGIESAHIVGISMGGMIAQELALARPDLVSTLTLGCTYCGGEGSSVMSPELARRLADARKSGDRERAILEAWEANVSSGVAEDPDAFAPYREICFQRAVAVPVILAQLDAINGHDTNGRLSELTMPTLVIHGTADQILPVENGRLVASQIPGSRLEIFEEVGHLFFWERPDHSAELVREHAAVPAGS